MPNTTTDSGVSSLPTTDSGNEESQSPKEKAPVRFGWVTGVMVSSEVKFVHFSLIYIESYIIYHKYHSKNSHKTV